MEGAPRGDVGDGAPVTDFRFILMTQEDPFYVRLFFEEFLACYPKRNEIAAVVIAPAMGKRSLGKLIRQMYNFYGAWDFLRMGMRYAYYKVRSRLPVWKGGFYSIRQVCERYGIPALGVTDVNSPECLAALRALAPDLIVSVAAPQVFKADLIALPRLGCINIHNSKLPKYRGMLPNFWQMYHGEKAVGTTIHRINARLDDGEILLQQESEIGGGETLDALIRRTKRQGARLMIEAIDGLKRGTLIPLPNPAVEATYFPFPKKQDVKQFRKMGYRII